MKNVNTLIADKLDSNPTYSTKQTKLGRTILPSDSGLHWKRDGSQCGQYFDSDLKAMMVLIKAMEKQDQPVWNDFIWIKNAYSFRY